LKVHHFGYIVKDIDELADNFAAEAIKKRICTDWQRAE